MKRTTCDCRSCTAGCKTMPGALIPGDLEKIQKHMHRLDGDFVFEHFRASEGTVALQMTASGQQQRIEVPTIVPAQKEDGRCVFLDENDHCSIHEVAPFGCAYHDTHMGAEEAHKRSLFALRKQAAAHTDREPYSAWWHLLNILRLIARPRKERHAAMCEMIEEIEREDATTPE